MIRRVGKALLKLGMATIASGLLATGAAAQGHSYHFDISNQSLSQALRNFGQISGQEIIFTEDLVAGVTAAPLKGEFTAEAALSRLLKGTGLVAERSPSGALMIRRKIDRDTSNASQPATTRERPSYVDNAIRLSQAEDRQISADKQTTDPSKDQTTYSDSKTELKKTALEEILVTATKRSERLQDVPVSVAVIRSQDIERRGLIGMEDYLRQIPGVNQIDRGGLDNAIVIRGITTSPESENFSSGTTVASYFDETPITGAGGVAAGGIDVRPVDIERIEVLRGPQGTTFGDASLGGTMRMIPAKPKLDAFGAKVSGYLSNTERNGGDNWMAQGVVNIPVIKDRFAVRGVAYRYDESGFYRNIAGIDPDTLALAESLGLGDFVRGHVQEDVGRIVTDGGRVATLWQPTDTLDLSLNFLTQKIEGDGLPAETTGTYEQAAFPIAPQRRVRGKAGEVGDTDMDLVNLVINYDFGWAELTTIGSRVDGGQAWAFARNAPFGTPSDVAQSDFESLTAEARLASQLEGRFQFLVGLFYEDEKDELLEIGDWPGDPDSNPFGTNPQSVAEITRDLDQGAIFGEVSYDLTDKLTAAVGGRYFNYDRKERTLFEGGLFGVPFGEGIAEIVENDESDSTFKANLSYKPTQDRLLYASWGEGFRLGHPTFGLPGFCDTDGDGLVDGTDITIESTRTVASDFLESYEIGAKFAFFDRRMIVDAAVYHIEWDGLPIFTIAGGTGPCAGFGYTANVGAATSDGVEFQTSLIVAEGLQLDFGVGYGNAELSEDAPGLGAEEGARLPASPEFSANLSAQYDFEVAGYKAFLRGDSFYAGEFFSDLQESPGLRAGDYLKVDARVGVEIRNLSVELFVRNLTDEDAFTWRAPFFTLGSYRLRPRTVGIQLGYSFD